MLGPPTVDMITLTPTDQITSSIEINETNTNRKVCLAIGYYLA